MKFNSREKRLLSITIAACGIFLIGSGLAMNATTKTVTKTRYSLNIEKKKISETQAKTNEIKLKEIETEVNLPVSVDVKDYLENINEIDNNTLKLLKLDTSLVNIAEPGTYQYSITYNKKKYVANIIVKAKELPTITLKDLSYEVGNVTLSPYPKDYINEELTPEVYNTCTIDKEQMEKLQEQTKTAGNYEYSIICGEVTYTGKIAITSKPKQSVEIKVKNLTVYSKEEVEKYTIKDFIENADTIDESILNNLKVDLSQVDNIKGGTYTVSYNNKTARGTITIISREISVPPLSNTQPNA